MHARKLSRETTSSLKIGYLRPRLPTGRRESLQLLQPSRSHRQLGRSKFTPKVGSSKQISHSGSSTKPGVRSAFVTKVDGGLNVSMQALMDGAFSGCCFQSCPQVRVSHGVRWDRNDGP